MWGYPYSMPWFGMFFGPIMMIGVMMVCAVVMLLIVRNRGMGMPWGGERSLDPLEILRKRFARGEIDQVEYEERRRVLSQM
jgi:putative membrane protein